MKRKAPVHFPLDTYEHYQLHSFSYIILLTFYSQSDFLVRPGPEPEKNKRNDAAAAGALLMWVFTKSERSRVSRAYYHVTYFV